VILLPNFSSMKMASIIRFLGTYKRVIVLLLIFAYCVFLLLADPGEFGASLNLIFFAILLIFIASQFFWIGRILDLGERFIPGKPRRGWLAIVTVLLYLFIFAHSYPSIESTNAHIFRAADYRLHSTLIEGAFWWWFVGSPSAFALVIAFGMGGPCDLCGCMGVWPSARGYAKGPCYSQARGRDARPALVRPPPLA